MSMSQNVKYKIEFKFLFITLFILFINIKSFAALTIPSGLSDKDQRDILNTLGPATAARLLSAPYPLGGSEGFELGLGRQYMPTESLSTFGNKTEPQEGLSYPIITLGKGLFNDVDMYLSAIPFTQSPNLTHFSAQTRIAHWYSKTSPLIISSAFHIGSTTLKNQVTFENYGFDVLATMYLKHICLYTGLGTLFSNGTFIGGNYGVTTSGSTETVAKIFAHKLIGVDLRYEEYFVAAQVDSYERPNYSVKVGYRF
jgi:hypothetical protein